jgi:hypothetical protein
MAEKNVPGGFLGAGGLQIPVVLPGIETLAATYNAGVNAIDQTLILTDAKGGAFIINATTPGPSFTGVTAFEINVIGGSTNFYTKGGFDVSSSLSVAAAVGSVWNEVGLLASTITLTGGPAVATTLSMVRVGSGTVNGVGNTVSDAYNLFVDAAPAGTATITRAWSFGTSGKAQFGGNISVPDGAVATPSINFSTDATCGLYHTGTGATGSILASINGAMGLSLISTGLGVGVVPIAPLFRLHVRNAVTPLVAVSSDVTADVLIEGPSRTIGSSESNLYIVSNSAIAANTGGSLGFGAKYSGDAFSVFACVKGGYLVWATRPNGGSMTEHVRLDAVGNLGVGTSAPAAASKLHVVAAKTVASAAGAVYDGVKLATSAVSITGNTAITTAAGFNFTTIQAPTIAGNLATCAITNAATLTITNAPTAGANVTIANPYAFWVQAGNSKFNANILVGGAIGATAAKTIALSNSATAPTTTVDLCHLYSADIAVDRATLAIFTEEAVTADIGLASTHSHVIFINGVKYKLMLVAA